MSDLDLDLNPDIQRQMAPGPNPDSSHLHPSVPSNLLQGNFLACSNQYIVMLSN